MKNKIWVYAEQVESALDRVTLELLTKARDLAKALKGDTEIAAVLLGKNVKRLCETLADYGTDVIYVGESDALELYNPILYSRLITDLVKQEDPDILLFGATAIGSELGPTVAAQLKTGVAAHCVDIRINEKGLMVASVPSFGGKILGEILCPDNRPQMASVKPGIFLQGEKEPKEPAIHWLDTTELQPEKLSLKAIRIERKALAGVPLDKADVVFCGGYGIGTKENWDKLETLASRVGGAAASTRPVVDEGWAPGEEVMVGTSGKSIRPKAYVGFGISGATHHVCGMKDSGLVISVNKDDKAPVFEVSDFNIVADATKVLDLLMEKIQ